MRFDVFVVGDLVGHQTEALVSELRSSQPWLEVISTGDNAPFSLDDLVGGVAASVR